MTKTQMNQLKDLWERLSYLAEEQNSYVIDRKENHSYQEEINYLDNLFYGLTREIEIDS